MDRFFAAVAASLSFLAVACGAFGAHALKNRITPDLLAVFDVGVRYHLHHALALFIVALLNHQAPSRGARASGWCFIVGTVLFSGSLYILALTGVRYWGAVTPFGGVSFLAGWFLLGCAAWQAGRKP
jgi:uncharacterized membrane protein YgdD (TMEM256/DUF423 family)